MEKILVIKLGALGDFIQATGVFNDIRAAHKKAHITLLTTKGMLGLAQEHPAFDAVTLDTRPSPWHLREVGKLKRKLRGFDMVYDLQNNDRTGWYFKLAKKPKWSGIARGCSHPQILEDRRALHNLDRIEDQIMQACIKQKHKPNVTYAREDASDILKAQDLTKYAVIVAGCSPQHPEKRWGKYVDLVHALDERGIRSVLVGTKAEEDILNNIAKKSNAVNLCNQTNLGQLIDILAKASFAVGNDTGPMHIAAASGCPKGLTIFGSGSAWNRCAPKAKGFSLLEKANINDNTVEAVLKALKV